MRALTKMGLIVNKNKQYNQIKNRKAFKIIIKLILILNNRMFNQKILVMKKQKKKNKLKHSKQIQIEFYIKGILISLTF